MNYYQSRLMLHRSGPVVNNAPGHGRMTAAQLRSYGDDHHSYSYDHGGYDNSYSYSPSYHEENIFLFFLK